MKNIFKQNSIQNVIGLISPLRIFLYFPRWRNNPPYINPLHSTRTSYQNKNFPNKIKFVCSNTFVSHIQSLQPITANNKYECACFLALISAYYYLSRFISRLTGGWLHRHEKKKKKRNNNAAHRQHVTLIT